MRLLFITISIASFTALQSYLSQNLARKVEIHSILSSFSMLVYIAMALNVMMLAFRGRTSLSSSWFRVNESLK